MLTAHEDVPLIVLAEVDMLLAAWDNPTSGRSHRGVASRFFGLELELGTLFRTTALDHSDSWVDTVLTCVLRQSKLSQDELNQLQKDTHFDKKELQQWYKGWLSLTSSEEHLLT